MPWKIGKARKEPSQNWTRQDVNDAFKQIFDQESTSKSGCVSSSGENGKCIQQKSFVKLSNDFEQLLDPQNSFFADVKLVCGGVSIPAHKKFLSVRSPVFTAMFKNQMKESYENRVDITDMEASVPQSMMIYIYSGKASNLTVSSASDLLFAAEKYQLQELKDLCCDFLKNNLTLRNVLRVLVLGDLHSEDLKSFAMDYISNKCRNFSEFENTEEWKVLRKERPTLAMDILAHIVKSRDKK